MIRPRMVSKIWRRHARELVKDRRTLFALLFIPALVVILFSVQREELSGELAEQGSTSHKVVIQGAPNAPEFASYLRAHRLTLTQVPDAQAAVRDKKAPAGIVIPRGFDSALAAGRQPRVVLISGERSLRAQFAQAALASAVQGYGRAVLVERLKTAGLPASAADPIAIEPRDVTTARQRAGSLLGEVLPFMLLGQVVGLMSGIASDVTVGEKERRTVESMLASPLTRREIATGKWLITASVGLLAGAVTLTATILALRFTSSGDGGGLQLPLAGLGVAAIGVVAIVLVLSSLQLAVGFFARTTQQAGVFLTPLVLIAFVPLFFFQTRSGSSVGALLYAMPALGPSLLIKFGVQETAHALAVPIVIVTSLLYAGLGLTIADRLFHSERALLRAGG